MLAKFSMTAGDIAALAGAKIADEKNKLRKRFDPPLMTKLAAKPAAPPRNSAEQIIARVAAELEAVLPENIAVAVEETTALVKRSWRLLRQDQRKQHLATMALDKEELSPEEIEADVFFRRSLFFSAIATACLLIYPPMISGFVPFFFYASWPFYKKATSDIFVKRKITTDSVDFMLGVSTLLAAPVLPNLMFVNLTSGLVRSYTFKIIAATKYHTRKHLTNLMGQQPQSVWLLRDGVEVEAPFASVTTGDILAIDAGQMIPIDGVITHGIASVDQHLLTGEAQPIEKGVGDLVFAATVVLSGRILIQVEKTGEETAVARIGQMLLATADYTSAVELRGVEISDRMAGPTVLLVLVALPFFGFTRAITLFLSGFGYNMKLLGPLSVLNFLQLTALDGILIKDGRALEQISKVDTVVFDKTGTLTLEQPHVAAIYPYNGYDEATLLTYAAAAEQRQTHPIAKAILHAAGEVGLTLPTIDQASYQIGYGIQVTLAGKLIRVGSNRFMTGEAITLPPEVQALAGVAQDQGNSLVYVAVDDQLAGVIELHPTVRPEAKRIIDDLHQRGLKTCIISGDNERPTRALAAQLGIDSYFAETLPENKASLIAQLQAEGRFVCFVGDGINDSIALKQAQVSISLRGATTVATDTAQIILMDESLNQLARLFTLSEKFEANMATNLKTTIVPGVVIIGSIVLGLVGYAGAMGLFWVGGIAGILNAMRPLFEAQEIEENRLVEAQ